MDNQKATFLMLTLVSIMVLFASHAHAQALNPEQRAPIAAIQYAGATSGVNRGDPARRIRSAVRKLEQAALQLDFSSNERELELLQSARDRLALAIGGLCCAQRERAAGLQADIDHVIVRDASRLGLLVSPEGNEFGPPAPTRSQLAQLVSEGQELVRDAPVVRRLRTSRDLDFAIPPSGAAAASGPLAPTGPARTDSPMQP